MKRNRFFITLFGLLITFAALHASAMATTVMKMSVEDLTKQSTSIARGKVVSSKCKWIDHRICTITTIDVSRCYKGKLGKRVEITQLGGTIGRLTTRAPGSVTFEDGEDVLVFIFKNKRGMNMITGLGQGKYRVFTDKKTGKLMLRPGLGAIKIVDPRNPYRVDGKSRHRTLKGARRALRAVPFDSFISRVKEIVESSERSKKTAE